MNEGDQDTLSSGAVSFSINLEDTSVQSISSDRHTAAISDVCEYTGIETIIAQMDIQASSFQRKSGIARS